MILSSVNTTILFLHFLKFKVIGWSKVRVWSGGKTLKKFEKKFFFVLL